MVTEICPAFDQQLQPYLIYKLNDTLTFENSDQQQVKLVVSNVKISEEKTVKCSEDAEPCDCTAYGEVSFTYIGDESYAQNNVLRIDQYQNSDRTEFNLSYTLMGKSGSAPLGYIENGEVRFEEFTFWEWHHDYMEKLAKLTVGDTTYQEVFVCTTDTIATLKDVTVTLEEEDTTYIAHNFYYDVYYRNRAWRSYFNYSTGFIGFHERYSDTPYLLKR